MWKKRVKLKKKIRPILFSSIPAFCLSLRLNSLENNHSWDYHFIKIQFIFELLPRRGFKKIHLYLWKNYIPLSGHFNDEDYF